MKKITFNFIRPMSRNESKGRKLRISSFALVVSALMLIMNVACNKEPATIEVASVQLNKTSVTLHVGETADLTATVTPDNATNKTVFWTSSNTSVATISNGRITAMSIGSTTITAKCGNVQATCTVTVNPIEVTSILLNKTSVTLHVGETAELTATVTPDNATDKTVTWTSSNTEVATVENGKVTAVAVGSATITAQCGNVQAICTINVSPIEVTSIQLNKTSVTLYAGETAELTATVVPDNAPDKTVTWTSSNTEVATVENGKVTAVAVGSATITAKSNNDISVTCRIVVVEKDVVPPGGSERTGEEEWE